MFFFCFSLRFFMLLKTMPPPLPSPSIENKRTGLMWIRPYQLICTAPTPGTGAVSGAPAAAPHSASSSV